MKCALPSVGPENTHSLNYGRCNFAEADLCWRVGVRPGAADGTVAKVCQISSAWCC